MQNAILLDKPTSQFHWPISKNTTSICIEVAPTPVMSNLIKVAKFFI